MKVPYKFEAGGDTLQETSEEKFSLGERNVLVETQGSRPAQKTLRGKLVRAGRLALEVIAVLVLIAILVAFGLMCALANNNLRK